MSKKREKFYHFGFSNAIFLLILIVACIFISSIFYLQKTEAQSQLPSSQSASTQDQTISTKRLIKSEDIILKKVKVTPKIPKYKLPLKTTNISNFKQFSKKIKLSSQALSLLKQNGFVVIPTPSDFPKDDFAAYYTALKWKELPIFITTDSLLHYYRIFFDITLMKLEKDLFYDDIWQMSKEFFDYSLSVYNASSGDLKEAAKRNVAYFSVALKLLQPKANQIASKENIGKEIECDAEKEYCDEIISNLIKEGKFFGLFNAEEVEKYTFKTPDFVKDLVQKELDLIEKHEGWEFSPIFIYKEDYSQYVPRGHYTKSEKLKNYFKAMMWYGRMTHLIKGTNRLQKGQSECLDDGIISTYDAKIQTLQASLISNKFSQSKNIKEKWQRLYNITSFFVGFSDDLGPYEYSAVLNSLFKRETPKAQDLENRYSDIRDALLSLPYSPKIYSGLGECMLTDPLSSAQANRFLINTKGFRLMGQRFTIDSYLLSQIIYPYTGKYTGNRTPRPFTWVKTETGIEARGFPRGLDVMALLGSKRAKEILTKLGDTEYSDYEKKFKELKSYIDSLPLDEWFQNLYWGWLYVLRSLLTEFGNGYQTFMQTKAWQDKNLNTALASWAALRHDTILYVKQTYTIAERGGEFEEPIPTVGYVEPVPEFYTRLLTLTKITNKGLRRLVPEKELEKLKIEDALNEFSEILEKLLNISQKELENKPLTKGEYDFIQNFGSILKYLVINLTEGEPDPDIFKTTLIADVHTDGNTKQVLEEGVGYIKTLVVAYKLPQGHILLGIGPVFSYYEFKQPMDNRLNDEAWREMLNSKPPAEPEWIKSFSK